MDGQETNKEISNEQEEAQAEDGDPVVRRSSGSKISLGFQVKGLCLERIFVHGIGF